MQLTEACIHCTARPGNLLLVQLLLHLKDGPAQRHDVILDLVQAVSVPDHLFLQGHKHVYGLLVHGATTIVVIAAAVIVAAVVGTVGVVVAKFNRYPQVDGGQAFIRKKCVLFHFVVKDFP